MTIHPDLEEALSLERFGRYLAWAGGDRDHALHLYALNTRLSEALYTPLQVLEVVLRNRVRAVLSASHGPRWFEDLALLPGAHQPTQVQEARAKLAEERKADDPGRIVAALTLGFWTAMLGAAGENLWQTRLKAIARREDGRGLRRKDLSAPLTPIRLLRNRIAHHEPILEWNLPKHHEAMLRITNWLSPAAAAWCRTLDRFAAVHPLEQIELRTDASGRQ